MSLFDSGVRPNIDEYIQTKREEERDYGNYWSASSAGYCMRKNIFERLKVPHTSEDKDRLQRVFEVGHIFHSWVQGITKETGLSIAQEVELQDEELMIRGHFDDLILKDGNLILYDYKTAHSRSFHYSKDRPMSYYHRLQLATYMYMLRNGSLPKGQRVDAMGMVEAGVENLTDARVLKISKDDLCMEEKQVLWTPELEQEVLEYWTTLNKYWNDKKLPPCTCADQEGGFMAKPDYNNFFYEGEPCSVAWYELCKAEGKLNVKETK